MACQGFASPPVPANIDPCPRSTRHIALALQIRTSHHKKWVHQIGLTRPPLVGQNHNSAIACCERPQCVSSSLRLGAGVPASAARVSEGRRRFKGGRKLLQPATSASSGSNRSLASFIISGVGDTNFATRLERPIAFIDDELRRGKRHVLDHVLGAEIVHGLLRKGKALGHIDEHGIPV